MFFKNKKFNIVIVLIIIVFIISFLSIMMQPKQMQIEGFRRYRLLVRKSKRKRPKCIPCSSTKMKFIKKKFNTAKTIDYDSIPRCPPFKPPRKWWQIRRRRWR
jgi:hypothetical protein